MSPKKKDRLEYRWTVFVPEDIEQAAKKVIEADPEQTRPRMAREALRMYLGLGNGVRRG